MSGLAFRPTGDQAAQAGRYDGAIDLTPDPIPVPALRIPVAFSAPDEAGTAELTWGQREIWLAMARVGWMRLGGTVPLKPGTGVEQVADELRYLMTRYPSFRTRLRFDASGRPSQEVFNAGVVTLDVFDVDVDDEPDGAADALAAAVEAHYQTKQRDFSGEWPIRMGVVRRDGVPTHMLVQTCHLVSDGAGAEIFLREIPARESAPVPGMTTLQLARWQCSPEGQLHQAATERHWSRVLAALPTPPPLRPDPRTPRHWSGRFDSPALRLALPHLVARTGAGSSAVLLALYAIALGRLEVLSPAVVRPLVHNRFRPGVEQLVSNVVQSGLCVVDVADITVDEAVRRAKRATFTAWKHAYFDPEKIDALLSRHIEEHGPHLGFSTYFNDRRAEESPAPGAPADASVLAEAAGRSDFAWFEKKPNPYEPLFLHLQDGPDCVQLVVSGDTHCIAPVLVEQIPRIMEVVAIEAALDPATRTGVR